MKSPNEIETPLDKWRRNTIDTVNMIQRSSLNDKIKFVGSIKRNSILK